MSLPVPFADALARVGETSEAAMKGYICLISPCVHFMYFYLDKHTIRVSLQLILYAPYFFSLKMH